MKFTSIFLILISLLAEVSVQSADTTKLIDRLFMQWHNATPGGAILITGNEKVFYDKSFGLADLARNVPNTAEIIFECGSVSKQFTAISILILAHEGKLNLQDDVHKYVPELPNYGQPIRIQHLLNHTSDNASQLFEFIRNKQGNISGLLVSQTRVEKVSFTETAKTK